MGPEMPPLQVTCLGELMETAEKLNIFIKKFFLEGDALTSVHRRLMETGYFLPKTSFRVASLTKKRYSQ